MKVSEVAALLLWLHDISKTENMKITNLLKSGEFDDLQ